MKIEPLVVAVILNWKSSDDCIGLVHSLREMSYKNVEILLVDNCSPDGSAHILRDALPDVPLILTEKNLGYAGGNNVGIRVALDKGADYVWILNPDIRVTKDTLSHLVAAIAHDERIAVAGPRICSREHPSKIVSDGGCCSAKDGYYPYHKNAGCDTKSLEVTCPVQDVHYVNGSAFLARNQAIRKVGLFRSNFFMYFEETEWCLRAWKKGFRSVVNAEAVVYHTGSQQNIRYHFFMTRNRIWLAKMDRRGYCGRTLLLISKEILRMIRHISYRSIRFLLGTIMGLICGLVQHPGIEEALGK